MSKEDLEELKEVKSSNDKSVKLDRIENKLFTKKAQNLEREELKKFIFDMIDEKFHLKIGKHKVSPERKLRVLFGVLAGIFFGLRCESIVSTKLKAFSLEKRPESQIDEVERRYMTKNIYNLAINFREVEDLKVNIIIKIESTYKG